MAKECIDLRKRFGERYRIELDPAAKQEIGGKRDPWLYIIPCRKGHIYPYSDGLLGLWWETTACLDRLCPALTLHLDGEDEKVYLFKVEDFEQVAEVAGARRRRRLSPAQREAAISRLRPFQKA